MKYKFVNVFNISQLKNDIHGALAQIDGQWFPARPIGYIGLLHRIKCAWEVFQGRADIVKWYKQ